MPQIGAPTGLGRRATTARASRSPSWTPASTPPTPTSRTRCVAAKNFTPPPTPRTGYGHGTHVASIAAGTGAKSGGKYKGVAPGAKLLNGKVLDDDGYGDDSGIIAGMEWAADQGADVVNLSLGGRDTPGIDPLEAEVNKLSAEKGILFAIAAGNEGEAGQDRRLPGQRGRALTVGAVDDHDKLADFSSMGPRVGDGAIKPDVTAPGVDITAAAAPGSVIDKEVGEKPAGYLTHLGYVDGDPACRGRRRHPQAAAPRLDVRRAQGRARPGSAKGGKYTPFQQGSGRIQVDKAIKQTRGRRAGVGELRPSSSGRTPTTTRSPRR